MTPPRPPTSPRARDRARERRPPAPLRHKRALTNVGGAVERRGDEAVSRELAAALDVEPGAGLDRWTHGFHTWAARMHPDVAQRLVRSFGRPGAAVLDPFCGSGTVVVEALAAGCRPLGRDLHPLGVRLARLRSAVVPEARRKLVRERARRIAGLALGRVRQGHRPPGNRPPGDDLFDSRTLAELAWLRLEIRNDHDPFVREALELVLSSILVKLSCRTSDTDPRPSPHASDRARDRARDRDRFPPSFPSPHASDRANDRANDRARDRDRFPPSCRAPGSATRLFVPKVDELCRRWKTLREALPERALPADVQLDDARRLHSVPDGIVDLVVTSPPYANVYDYADQHALRVDWLGLDDLAFQAGEVGARRSFRDPQQGAERWERDGRAWVGALARVLRPGAPACILGGDGATALGPLRFDECLARWASDAGLQFVASTAQRRPIFDDQTRRAYPTTDRREHLILLRRS